MLWTACKSAGLCAVSHKGRLLMPVCAMPVPARVCGILVLSTSSWTLRWLQLRATSHQLPVTRPADVG